MNWIQKISHVQQLLKEGGIDGWLLYDFHGSNSLAQTFLEIRATALVTRRLFYWIPAQGEPIKILHKIESHHLEELPGKVKSYLEWQQLHSHLSEALKGKKVVAMEFSPGGAIPTVSKVDGGVIDLVRSFGVEVVSSAPFLQYYTCRLDPAQRGLHLEAAAFLDATAAKVWEKIATSLRLNKPISEYDVRHFIHSEMEAHGFTTKGLPICAVNEHSADPHFEPKKQGSAFIKPGDLILIDLWCKKNVDNGVYADITRMAVASSFVEEEQKKVFDLVRLAQKTATDFVIERYRKGVVTQGCEVDQVCRAVIEKAGYGEFFTHRTGHNIYTEDHGPGANIDNLETLDLRPLIPNTCFSIEPGIYLPGRFGIRLEYDILLGDGGEALVTGGIQERFVTLF